MPDKMVRDIQCLCLHLTNVCSMRCPDCTASIPEVPRDNRTFYAMDYFERAAPYFHGIERLNLTGGEPTLHPQFPALAGAMRALFQCQKLTIESNGYGFRRFQDAFSHFDKVYPSHYTAASYPGCPDNTDDIEFLRRLYPDKVHANETVFTPKSTRGTRMCFRGRSETVAYANGRLYPCCVGPGLPVPHGIPLTPNWRVEILSASMPCSACWFAEP